MKYALLAVVIIFLSGCIDTSNKAWQKDTTKKFEECISACKILGTPHAAYSISGSRICMCLSGAAY